ncbi:uncharacterized protein LOC127871057 [Dreissena polymorpha]|uniref:Uncharacterized protein n=1 Tax=Dreissena polymorpha TaxID=45954 RepID=A0A9D4LCJ2_DREPO|nr:uncharacterized protein LOC127871057 [Dreissena polymorpha]KAH3855621.1 hypothetical protein DPMN_098191 [Dreissena polymorpha]
MDFKLLVAACVTLAGSWASPVKRYTPTFSGGSVVAHISSNTIIEASGLCASRIHAGVLYTHNDSGDRNRIFAMSTSTGRRLMTIEIDGAHALDWEDIACGPCDGTSGHCIYVADTGGNAGGDANTIYKIREPTDDLIHGNGGTMHVHLESKLEFSWDQHDCETVMVDNHGEVYVVSKVSAGNHPKLVHLPHSAWGTNHRVFVNEGVHLPVTTGSYDPVGGDISPDGHEVLLKTYGHVYYWYVPDGDYYKHMTSAPLALPYTPERQGEAVCFDSQAAGYYTMSEGKGAPLYYYRRTNGAPVVG